MVNWTFPNAQYRPPAQVDTRGLDRLANVMREQQQQQREAEAAAQAAQYRQQRDDRSFGLQERQYADNQDYRKLQLAQDDRRFGAQQSYQNRQLQHQASLQEQRLKHEADIANSKNGRGPQYGKAGSVFEMNGRTYTAQFADDGTRKIVPLDSGMVPANLSPNLAAKKESALGNVQSLNKAKSALSGAVGFASMTLPNLDAIMNHDRLSSVTGWNRNLPTIRNDTSGLELRIKQAEGSTLLQGVKYLKGTGALSDRESGAASATVARMNTAQSAEDYQQAAREYRAIIVGGVRKAYEDAGTEIPPNVKSMLDGGGPAAGADNSGWSIKPKGQ